MSKTTPVRLLLLLFLWLPNAAWASEWEEGLSDRQIAQAQKGEVVVRLRNTPRNSMKVVEALGYINAPAEAVWNIITDYDHYSKIYSGVIKSELRSTLGATSQIYLLLDYPWPFPDKWVLCEASHHPESWDIGLHRREGTMKTVEGGWQLYPAGNKTMVVYAIQFDPGLGFLPPWLLEWGTSQAAPIIITGLRDYLKASQS